MVELFANKEDPDQMPGSVASDLGLHSDVGLQFTKYSFRGSRL